MTITSTGPSGFHVKPLITAFAVTIFVAAIVAVGLWAGSDGQQSNPSQIAVSNETADAYAGPSGLVEAYKAGKYDAGPASTQSQPVPASAPAPETVVISGEGALSEALIDGKFATDFGPQASNVEYVRGFEVATADRSLSAAFDAGKLDAGLVPEQGSTAGAEYSPKTVVVTGQSGLHDALVSGKLTADFDPARPGVQFVRIPNAAMSSGLSAAAAADRLEKGFGDSAPTEKVSPGTAHTPTLSGGHQQ